MKIILTMMLLSLLIPMSNADIGNQAPDYRPPFDKSAYKGTVWTEANPWFLPNRSRTHGWGGPDFAWKKFSDDPVTMWKEVAEVCKPYGITGIQLEHLVPDRMIIGDVLEGFKRAGNDFKLELFVTVTPYGNANVASEVKRLNLFFDNIQTELKNHPNLYRLDGKPVLVIYNAPAMPYSGKDWGEIIGQVEKKHGRMIWLADVAANMTEAKIKEFIPYFDGVSMYAVWNDQMQKDILRVASGIMKKYPKKIFEAAVHTTYTVHFKYGSIFPNLLEKYLNSWKMTIAAKPDSITITNLFDCYENSRILPSYELDDIMLRIAKYQIKVWREEKSEGSSGPEIYISNFTNVLLGKNAVFEVTGFPLKDVSKTFSFQLQVCNAKGEVLHVFPWQEWKLDTLKDFRVELPTFPLAAERAVFPRLLWRWDGKESLTQLLRPSILMPGMRPHVLFWSRSLENQILLNSLPEWSLGGKKAGETLILKTDTPFALLKGRIFTMGGPLPSNGGGWVRILRNGLEIDSFANWDLNLDEIIRLRNPLAASDYYSLELENPKGGRYATAPVWVSSGLRSGQITMPVYTSEGKIENVVIDADRVPFFYYKCEDDMGFYLLDSSGYDHYGLLGPAPGGCGGSLGSTGYRFEHWRGQSRDAVDPKYTPAYKTDAATGQKYLEFSGNQYVSLMGGTAFNYASTYELKIKPAIFGKKQGLLGSGNGQINLIVLENGKVELSRTAAVEAPNGTLPGNAGGVGKIVSKDTLSLNKWYHLAAVYDLKTLSLYINGKLQGECRLSPNSDRDIFNWVTVGCSNQWLFTPINFFNGGIRDIRIYGRNLNPEEFLK